MVLSGPGLNDGRGIMKELVVHAKGVVGVLRDDGEAPDPFMPWPDDDDDADNDQFARQEKERELGFIASQIRPSGNGP